MPSEKSRGNNSERPSNLAKLARERSHLQKTLFTLFSTALLGFILLATATKPSTATTEQLTENDVASTQLADEYKIRSEYITGTQTAMPNEEKRELANLIPREIRKGVQGVIETVQDGTKMLGTSIYLKTISQGNMNIAIVAIPNHYTELGVPAPNEIFSLQFDSPVEQREVGVIGCRALGELLGGAEYQEMAICALDADVLPVESNPVPEEFRLGLKELDPAATYLALGNPGTQSDKNHPVNTSYDIHPTFIELVDLVPFSQGEDPTLTIFDGLAGGGDSGGVVVSLTNPPQIVRYIQATNKAFAGEVVKSPIIYTSNFPTPDQVNKASEALMKIIGLE